ncbi:E4 protein [Bos taurus papillomavirus 20]|uniref:E4 protein n=1 Tax=Bos taurus papillomavirus 20 TaxID=1887218 RepID=A0A1B2K242_9PAPI|nr:E4 protein [Bos taurus papillomavirus 20]ANZ90263.1 E4 protein [Bos taurus papillomavirus 20]
MRGFIMWTIQAGLCTIKGLLRMLSGFLNQDSGMYSMKTKSFLPLLPVRVVSSGPPEDKDPKKGKTPQEPRPIPQQPDPDNPQPQPREGLLYGLHYEGRGGPYHLLNEDPDEDDEGPEPGVKRPPVTGHPDPDQDQGPGPDRGRAVGGQNLEDKLRSLLKRWEQELEHLRRALRQELLSL